MNLRKSKVECKTGRRFPTVLSLTYGGICYMENYIFPFLWMRGEPEDVIREEIAKISECGIRAVCVEARPHDDFCGPGWWHDMDIVLDEAKKRDMRIWILDDKHFPTGYANGLIEQHILDSVPSEAYLKAEEVYEVMRVSVNGIEAGTVLAPPYQISLGGLLRTGENELLIEVASTPARDQANYPSPPFDFFHEALEPAGMYGSIELYISM